MDNPLLPRHDCETVGTLQQPSREQGELRMFQTGAAGVSWARRLLQARPLFLDTETTGDDERAEVVEVAVVSDDGVVLLDTLVRPQSPITAAAGAVHGIGEETLVGAPSVAAIWPHLMQLLGGRTVVAYNVAFDSQVLQQSAARYGVPPLDADWVCLMEAYASLTGRSRVISLSAASRENGLFGEGPTARGPTRGPRWHCSRRWRRAEQSLRGPASVTRPRRPEVNEFANPCFLHDGPGRRMACRP
jgi:hypothetical protein